jgi:glycosyltransferase involved in cell wall biosynthesis
MEAHVRSGADRDAFQKNGAHVVKLLTYGEAFGLVSGTYAIDRIPHWPRCSARSGPSWQKVALDVRVAVALSRARARGNLVGIIAHHVEAAVAAVVARARPLVFVAHTRLDTELPGYFGQRYENIMRSMGGRLDAALVRRCHATCAVSPQLASTLQSTTGRPVSYLPIPWQVAVPNHVDERGVARATLGYDDGDFVLLYAGNFDAYQGCPMIVEAWLRARSTRPLARLLIGTADPRRALDVLKPALEPRDWPHVRVEPLDSEPLRRKLYAAADLVLVPRRTEGGVPIKLLDALARGATVLASHAALAGLPLAHVVTSAPHEAAAFAAAILQVGVGTDRGRDLGRRGPGYIREHHSRECFLREMSLVVGRASSGSLSHV